MQKKSEFLLTLASQTQLPELFRGPFLKGHREPRLVMVGRSNVGKSSLINALLKAPLAQTSNQPGKTRAIHFYHWKEIGKIVADLPGYGYARTAKTERNQWEKLIGSYLEIDENLERAIVLLDARHGPTESDLDAIDFLSSRGIPVTLVFSKVDTLKTQSERALRQREVANILNEVGIEPKAVFWVSSRTQIGLNKLVQDLRAPLKIEEDRSNA